RALPFSKLCDETGESEVEVRRVVDRFRADDCSFLIPSISATPTLEPETRIDVGHEALLRRWKRVSGETDVARTEDAKSGWLRAEEKDGAQYRWLRSWNDDNVGKKLPLNIINRWAKWWTERRPNRTWAERYGGDFDGVDRLIKASLARKRRVF